MKFRTIHVDSVDRLRGDPDLYALFVANDFKLPVDEDPRIITGGRLLRLASLDELPQLFNVLGGSMSLVGPRPVEMAQLASYGHLSWAYLEARPGLTGRWQTTGRSQVLFPERAELDADYLARWRLRNDLLILLKTVPAVVRRNGAR